MFKFVLYAQVIRGTFPFRPSPHKGKELLYGANLCTHDFLSPGCDFSRFWLKGQFNLNLKRWLTDKSPGRWRRPRYLYPPFILRVPSGGAGKEIGPDNQSPSCGCRAGWLGELDHSRNQSYHLLCTIVLRQKPSTRTIINIPSYSVFVAFRQS